MITSYNFPPASLRIVHQSCPLKYTCLFLFLLFVLSDSTYTYVIHDTLQFQGCRARNCTGIRKKIVPSETALSNARFVALILRCAVSLILCYLFLMIIIISGDIHPNPGPIPQNTSSPNSSFSSISSIDTSNYFSFIHYNVQSILTKLDILLTEFKDFDILAFSETWLGTSIPTEDLLLDSFHTPERKDRPNDNHGGVILYVKNKYYYKRRSDLEIQGVESIWIEIYQSPHPLLFGVFYRPPNTNLAQHSSIIDSIHLAFDTGIQNIIFTGDFNLNIHNVLSNRKINALCRDLSLTQHISEPTHYTESSQSTLDLIFSSNLDILYKAGVCDPVLDQDIRFHCPIYGLLKTNKTRDHSFTRLIWSFDRGDYTLLKSKALEVDWDMRKSNNIDTYASNITETISSLAHSAIPNRKVYIRPSDPPWFSSGLRSLIRLRKRAYHKAKRSNTPTDWALFRKLRNRVVENIRTSKHAHLSSLVEKLNADSKKNKSWWSCLKAFIKPNDFSGSTIPPLQLQGSFISDDVAKANHLNNFFVNQSVLDETITDPFPELPILTYCPLSNIHVTPLDVEDALKTLPVGKAPGPDGINNRILIELHSELSHPLCDLFNRSLSDSTFPDIWKKANVHPLFKSGDKSLARNYRPISLLDSLGKVFERIVFKHLFNYLRSNNILTPLQSGFVPGDSTVNQLVYLLDTISASVDSGKEVRAVFCDISKAFDRVWHSGLLYKIKSIGITGPLLNWFASYLTGRRQRVVLPGVASGWGELKAGVPQGSILGPLLFLIFINDIVTGIDSNIRLFADDTSLFLTADDPVSCANVIQSDLLQISSWANKWKVNFNPNKTETVIFSRKVNPPVHPTLQMLDTDVASVEHHKHLGLHLSHDLRWSHHIDYILSKAYYRLNIMRRLKFTLDRNSLETIYISFIRPILEYSDVLFDNCTIQEARDLESVQHEAARIVTGTTKLVSIDKLTAEVRWESLENRRRKHKLVFLYKMLHNLSPSYLTDMNPSTPLANSNYNMRRSDTYQQPRSRTNVYYNSYLPSAIRDYNELDVSIRSALTLTSFKRRLNSNVISVPKYFYAGNRRNQILHARLRTNCSSLANDLFSKNIVNSPFCACGHVETTSHYLLNCQRYVNFRRDLEDAVTMHTSFTLNTLLFGDQSLSNEQNICIFSAVHNYISRTQRF